MMNYIKLSELTVRLESGSRPKGGVSSDGIPSIGGEHIKSDGTFKFDNMKYVPEDFFNNLKKGVIDRGDILIVKDGATTGKVAFVDNTFPYKNAAINEHVFKLKINNEMVLPKYVFYYLYSRDGNRQLMKDFRGATVGGITKNFLNLVQIPIPRKLEFQNKIVTLLDKARELINKRKAQIEALDQLTQSVFLEMFGDPDKNTKQWNVYKLKEVVDKNCSISYGIVQPGDDVPNGVPIVRPVDIQQGIISVDNLKRTAKHISDAYSRTILKGCELLLTVRGTVGASYLVDESFKGVNVTRGITPLLFNEKIVNPIYIFHLFKTEQYQRKFKSLAKGITLLQINLIDLRELTLPVPPVTVQNEFSKFVKKITIQKKKLQNSLNEMETIFNSLMQRAFKGELFND